MSNSAALLSGDLVSIIVLVDNDWPAAKASLESVYQQSYAQIELLIMTSNQTELELDNIRQWLTDNQASQRFHNVIIDNSKCETEPCQLMNKGMSLAQGNALTILNAGDAYMPRRIELLMQAAEKHQADWLISAAQVINANGMRVFSDLAAEIEAAADFATHFPTISFALLKKNIVVTASNLFFSRDLYHKVGAFSHIQYYCEWDFALQACLISEPILLQEPLYSYKIQPNRTFTAQTSEQSLEQKIIYRRYFAACRAGNCTNPEAPWIDNWPGLFAHWIAEDQGLAQVYELVGQGLVKYDQLGNTLTHI